MTRLYAESPSQQTATIDEEGSKIASEEEKPSVAQRPSTIYIPLSFEEMVKQISSTMEDAMKEGKTRQTMRILLPRSSDADQIGQYLETNG